MTTTEVWQYKMELENETRKMQAIALKEELKKMGLRNEQQVKELWESCIAKTPALNGNYKFNITVKFLNAYCITDIELTPKH
ncbi:MAG: hypothetical protein KIH10_03625 [Candidatus Freyarchaeota archaeon]|nr:hypothetical protein [Candidatus Jordarchaeia archaeon]